MNHDSILSNDYVYDFVSTLRHYNQNGCFCSFKIALGLFQQVNTVYVYVVEPHVHIYMFARPW